MPSSSPDQLQFCSKLFASPLQQLVLLYHSYHDYTNKPHCCAAHVQSILPCSSNLQTPVTALVIVILINWLSCVVCVEVGYETISISPTNSLVAFACHVTQNTNDMIKALDFLKHVLWRRKLNIDLSSLSLPTSELSPWKMDKSILIVMSCRTIISYELALTPCVSLKIWPIWWEGP